MTPLIYLSIVYAFIFAISYEPRRDFDKKKWMENPGKRYYMSKDLIDNELMGKDTTQLKELLGSPERQGIWVYQMGEGSGGLGFIFHSLSIRLEQGKVAGVEHHRVSD